MSTTFAAAHAAGNTRSKVHKMSKVVAVHDSQGKKILVISDEDILGKKYIEGKLQLDLPAAFYKGEVTGDTEIKKMMRGAYVIHLVGRESVQMGIDEGFVDAENVRSIKSIPHAEVLL